MVEPKVWNERMKTENETRLKGVWRSCAFRENLTPALRVFAKQSMKKKKKKTTVFQATYVVVLQKVEKKDVIYTETVYNNKSFDKNLFWM